MKESYTILSKKDSEELNRFLTWEDQFLLAILELIEQAKAAVDEVIEVVGVSKSQISREWIEAPEDADKDGWKNIEETLNKTNPTEYIDYQNPKNNKNILS